MKKITKYEFEKGEMVVEVGHNYFKVLAQPEELRGKGVLLTVSDDVEICSCTTSEYNTTGNRIYLRGAARGMDHEKVMFDPNYRHVVINALTEFGAEVVEPQEDRYVWFNVYKDHDVLYLGHQCTSKLEAETVSFGIKRVVSRIKVKLEEGRWDE
jgi:hypothetical protein